MLLPGLGLQAYGFMRFAFDISGVPPKLLVAGHRNFEVKLSTGRPKTPPFSREMNFKYGALEPVAPGLRRIVCQNPGPFTFKGTNLYVIGEGEVAVVDPG